MKISVLFVDDDTDQLNILKKMLVNLEDEWNISFADNLETVTALLTKNSIDVVVTDIKMHHLDGKQLLVQIKKKFPQVIRIILSAQTDIQKSILFEEIAHQFLSKPCDPERLKSAIEKTCHLRFRLRSDSLVKLITGIGKLPSLPDIYIELEKELNSPDVSIQKISSIVSRDVAMTAKLLQFVNSSFFGLTSKITNIVEAVNYIGVEVLKVLVLYVKIFSSFEISEKNKTYVNELWQHSLKVAKIAKDISRFLNKDNRKMSDEAYVAGILHDIGKFVLLQMPDYRQSIQDIAQKEAISSLEAEYKLLGASHAEVGGYLLSLWGLPENIIEAVVFHHRPNESYYYSVTPLTAVHLANTIADMPALDTDYIFELEIDDQLFDIIKIANKS